MSWQENDQEKAVSHESDKTMLTRASGRILMTLQIRRKPDRRYSDSNLSVHTHMTLQYDYVPTQKTIHSCPEVGMLHTSLTGLRTTNFIYLSISFTDFLRTCLMLSHYFASNDQIKITSKQTRFRKEWLQDVEFSSWLQEEKDSYRARCSMCRYSFSLNNMGKRALKYHFAGKKHQAAVSISRSTMPLSSAFLRPTSIKLVPAPEVSSSTALPILATTSSCATQSSPSTEILVTATKPSVVSSASTHTTTVCRSTLKTYVLNDKVTEAEVRWCLQNVINHRSLRSAEKGVQLFPIMFSDSEIAAKMKMHRDKMAYITVYAFKPYFQNQLLDTLRQCTYYVLGFDESLNKISQKQQMDLTIRFWDAQKNEVCARYLTSAFLQKTTALDLLEAFTSVVSSLGLPLTKIVQISMNGLNVNFKFFKELQNDIRKEETDATILNMGSCGIHTMHCAFKAGINATGWEIIQFLRAIHNLFKNLPARRGTYTRLTSSTVFPMKFCAVRWLESNVVAQRALDILPHLKTFVKGVTKEKIAPSCESFKIIQKALADNLLPVKLAFFCTLASDLEPFMREFQTDIPMAPFLHSALAHILQNVMDRFVKPEILNVRTSIELVDFKDEKNLLPLQKIKLGHATNNQLRKCENLSDLDVLTFRKNCKTCLAALVTKLMERSPIKFRLTKAVSCFDPSVAVQTTIANNRLQNLLTILVDNNWMSGQNADEAARQFSAICLLPEVQEKLKNYRRENERLDHFWIKIFDRPQTVTIIKVMKMVMVLSHGNAQVERGFSINADCLLDNMREETLVSRRVTYDAVSAIGGVCNVPITKSLLHAARNARARFQEAKERRLKEDKENNERLQWKRQTEKQMKELKEKKAKIMEETKKEVDMIESEIEELKKK